MLASPIARPTTMPNTFRSRPWTLPACVALAVTLGSCTGGSVLLPFEDAGPDGPVCHPTTTVCSTGTDTHHYATGLEPLGDDVAPTPQSDGGDPYPEVLSVINGRSPHFYWVQARGFVHTSLMTTWMALQNPDVAVDRRRINHWTVEQVQNSPYAFAIVVHNEVDSLVTVNFDITWGGDVGEGTRDAPSLVSLRWDKTAGTTYITSIAGSCVLRAVDPNVTEVELIQEENAVGQDQTTITQFIEDFYASLLAASHGRPLPTY
jgi:hypothetical protein